MSEFAILSPEDLSKYIEQAYVAGYNRCQSDILAHIKALKEAAEDRLVSIREAAGILGISERQVRNLLAKGDLSRYNVESSPRIKLSDLHAYIERNKDKAPPGKNNLFLKSRSGGRTGRRL